MSLRGIRRKLTRIGREFADRTGGTERLISTALAAVTPGEGHHVLIAPPGAGNIGDQAMVEAFLAAADRPVTVVTRGADDFALPADLVSVGSIRALPGLFYGGRSAHADALTALAGIVNGAATVSIVGADIMDGVYVQRSSIRRSAIAAATARAGIDTTVLGFSWSSEAPAAAIRALRHAGASGARLLLRDPASAGRVRALGVAGVVETADIVFTDDRLDNDAAARVLGDVTGPIALVNASGLIARKVDQVAEYATVVGHLRRAGYTVVLLPHVLRSTADDLTACRAVHDAVAGPGVHLVEEVLAPSTIRALAGRASLTVTGRMHLAIMSLAQGTPAITLATQGKVEGLMRLFDWPQLCVAPRTGMADEITAVADTIASGADTRDRVTAGASRATELALANISRIRAVDAVGDIRGNERFGGRNGTSDTA